MRAHLLRPLFAVLCLSALPATLKADVLEVGAGHLFTDIQTAVDAASDGDHVLVHTGNYPAFTISGVGVSVIADAGESVTVLGRITVSDLTAGQRVVLQGLDTAASTGPSVDLLDNAGSVRIHDGALDCNKSGTSVVRVTDCDDVAFVGCSAAVTGAVVISGGAAGLHAVGSTVTVHDSQFAGGTGGPALFFQGNPGGAGLLAETSTVFLSGVVLTGGDGGVGSTGNEFSPGGPGGDGGAGLRVVGSVVRHLGSVFVGGAGGPGGAPDPIFGGGSGSPGPDGPGIDVQSGVAVPLAGTPRKLSMPSPAREQQVLATTLTGEPGDVAAVLWNPDTAHAFDLGVHGTLLVSLGPPAHLIVVGSLPGSGELPVNLAFPELGPGVDALTVFIQPLFLTTGGGLFAGAPVSEVVLDSAF